MFEKITSIPVTRDEENPPFDVSLYRSTNTGLSVAFAGIEGPLVNGFFALATEAFDDDGCPHTLEHLVFLGSDQYPYKGLLDRVANRCLAQGTNAWTEVDHTAYTVSTAGSEGFLQLLPVYLDHILYPTLTDSGCHTEVHYISGEGQNAGVVYSEMQGRENTKDDLIQLRLKRIMYPEPSGYRSETGGLMKNLRSLTADTIRKYHVDYYRPNNLCIIITGKIDHNKVFSALEPVEKKILEKSDMSYKSMPRPWMDSPPVPPFNKIVEESVEFPDENETVGSVYLSWRGPSFHQFLDIIALDIVWTYLTDSPVSLLQKNFVEIPSPLCSDIDVSDFYNLETVKCVSFENVPVEHLNTIRTKFFDIILSHLDEGIDMQRISLIIERSIRQRLESLETSAHYSLAMPILANFLYGKTDGSQLKDCLDDLDYYKTVKNYTKQDWTNIMREYIINRPYSCLKGKPSSKLAKENAKRELERIEAQRIQLGTERLAQLAKELEEAVAKNNMEIPSPMLLSFQIPSTDTISYFPVHTYKPFRKDGISENRLPSLLLEESSKCDLTFVDFQMDDVNSSFMEMTLYIDTSDIPLNLRLYLELFMDVMFALPILKNGELKPFEQVVKELDEDTVSYSNSMGVYSNSDFVCGSFPDQMIIAIKCEREKYKKGVNWLVDVLVHSQFTIDRLKVSVKKLLHSIPDHRREGYDMASMAMKSLIFVQESNHCALNVLTQQIFLKSLKRSVKDENEQGKILQDMNSLRDILCDPSRIRVHVVGRMENIETPILVWENTLFNAIQGKSKSNSPAKPLKVSLDYHNAFGKNPNNKGLMIALPTTDSAFSQHVTSGPTSFDNPDIPALLVLGEYLTTMEGPFWRDIRGQGLAYSCSIRVNPEQGVINFGLYRAADVSKAFEKAKQIIESLESGATPFDEKDIGGAQSAVLYTLISKYDNISGAATQSFINQALKKQDKDSFQKLLRNVQSVKVEDLKNVLHKYVRNIFDPSHCVSSIVVSPAKMEDAMEKFKEMGYNLQLLKNLDDMWPVITEMQQVPLILPVRASKQDSMDVDSDEDDSDEDDEEGDEEESDEGDSEDSGSDDDDDR